MRRIDWRRRDRKDAVVIALILIVQFLVFDVGDLFLKFADLAKQYEDWGADDVVAMSFVLCMCLVVYSFRRLQDLSKEVKARAAAEGEARNLSRHDPLTGLANRRYFTERLDEALLRGASDGRQGAVLMLDLDGL